MIRKIYSKIGAWLERRTWGKQTVKHVKRHKWAYELLETVVFVVTLTLLIRGYIIEAYKIPSGSMIPTLQIGDRLFVNKFRYRFWDIKVGDIIVFKVPTDIPDYDPRKPVYIKRVAGLPGDTVEIRDDHLSVNDRRVIDVPGVAQREYVNVLKPQRLIEKPEDLASRLTRADDPVSRYVRNLLSPRISEMLRSYANGKASKTELEQGLTLEFLRLIGGPSIYNKEAFANTHLSKPTLALIDQTTSERETYRLNLQLLAEAFPGEISTTQKSRFVKEKVPEGEVYVFGDNSKDSYDSRYWGGVPIKNIKGKAMFIWWPLNRIQFVE